MPSIEEACEHAKQYTDGPLCWVQNDHFQVILAELRRIGQTDLAARLATHGWLMGGRVPDHFMLARGIRAIEAARVL